MVLLKNYKGQAVVENVLILLVVIAVLLALQKVFFAPFRDSSSEYLIGKYYDCALDIGELPGSEALDDCFQKSTGIDPKQFKNKSGTGSISSQSGKDSSGSSNSNKSGKNGKGKDSNLAGRNQDNNKNKSSSSAGGAGGAAGKRLAAKKFGENGSDTGATGEAGGELGGKNGSGRSKSFTVGKVNNLGYQDRRPMLAKGISGEMKRKLEEELKKDKTIALKKDDSEGAGKLNKLKRFPAKAKESKIEDTLKEEPFTFGRFIKIALILMILIAIILFLVGQASQISKSMEK